uniref:BTB domain-containing protein n=1 Tax=Panagrolaimus sp. PS1159 TaxID=55785 RepID=A0AC35GW78_9BILA
MSFLETKFVNECQIRMKWRIKEDDVRSVQGSLFSDEFSSNIPGVKYSLMFYSNVNEQNVAFVYLCLDFVIIKEISATFTISVKSASANVIVFNQISDKSYGWGKILCESAVLFNLEMKFFVNGIMELELEGSLKAQEIKCKITEPLSLAKFLWENNEHKNLTITVEKKELKVHKWILCANSSVFEYELKVDVKKTFKKKGNITAKKTINITDFCYETVKIAIEFMYEQNVKEQITEENAHELIGFAIKYDIKSLYDMVEKILIEKISIENVCKLANLSVTFNAWELREFCVSFLMNYVGKNTVIKDVQKMDAEIAHEIGRRAIFSTSE